MNEEALKLERVKKSCKITGTVAQVVETMLLVGAAIALVSGILCFCLNNEINLGINTAIANSVEVDFTDAINAIDSASIGGLLKFTVDLDKLIENGEYGKVFGVCCIFATVICAVTSIVFEMLRRIFKIIRTSETPFSKEVLRGIKVMSIVICVEMLLMSGLGNGALAALIFWSIYNILDYGFTIQQQVDETL